MKPGPRIWREVSFHFGDIAPDAWRRRAVVLALLALTTGALDATAGGLHRRVRVDPDAVPWRAVGKLLLGTHGTGPL